MSLVLSLFPGIGLLDMAFEEEGFCVVRGPDLLWGGDIRNFHPPAGVFDGVIGGPPCQMFSRLSDLNEHAGKSHGNMIPEFERCVGEARPAWFVMENVRDAPRPSVEGYGVHEQLLKDVWVGGATTRLRRISFGVSFGLGGRRVLDIEQQALHEQEPKPTVLAGHGEAVGQCRRGFLGRTWQDCARDQGLSEEWIEHMESAPFTVHGRKKVIGNGVPLPMGRAIARAVKRAIQGDIA